MESPPTACRRKIATRWTTLGIGRAMRSEEMPWFALDVRPLGWLALEV